MKIKLVLAVVVVLLLSGLVSAYEIEDNTIIEENEELRVDVYPEKEFNPFGKYTQTYTIKNKDQGTHNFFIVFSYPTDVEEIELFIEEEYIYEEEELVETGEVVCYEEEFDGEIIEVCENEIGLINVTKTGYRWAGYDDELYETVIDGKYYYYTLVGSELDYNEEQRWKMRYSTNDEEGKWDAIVYSGENGCWIDDSCDRSIKLDPYYSKDYYVKVPIHFTNYADEDLVDWNGFEVNVQGDIQGFDITGMCASPLQHIDFVIIDNETNLTLDNSIRVFKTQNRFEGIIRGNISGLSNRTFDLYIDDDCGVGVAVVEYSNWTIYEDWSDGDWTYNPAWTLIGSAGTYGITSSEYYSSPRSLYVQGVGPSPSTMTMGIAPADLSSYRGFKTEWWTMSSDNVSGSGWDEGGFFNTSGKYMAGCYTRRASTAKFYNPITEAFVEGEGFNQWKDDAWYRCTIYADFDEQVVFYYLYNETLDIIDNLTIWFNTTDVDYNDFWYWRSYLIAGLTHYHYKDYIKMRGWVYPELGTGYGSSLRYDSVIDIVVTDIDGDADFSFNTTKTNTSQPTVNATVLNLEELNMTCEHLLDGVSGYGLVENVTWDYGTVSLQFNQSVPDGTYDYNMNCSDFYVDESGYTWKLTIDTREPYFTSVSVIEIEENEASISFPTDEQCLGTVFWGTAPATYTDSESGSTYTFNNVITTDGLDENTTYYYMVECTDSAGNTNSSAEYSFNSSYLNVSSCPDFAWYSDYPAMVGVNETFEICLYVEYNSTPLANVSANVTLDGVTYELINTSVGEYCNTFIEEDIRDETDEAVELSIIASYYGVYSNVTCGFYDTGYIYSGIPFYVKFRIWEELVGGNGTKIYDKTLTDPYLNEFSWIICRNDLVDCSGAYEICKPYSGIGQDLVESLDNLLTSLSFTADNQHGVENLINVFVDCNRCYFHDTYTGGEATLKFYITGNYSCRLIDEQLYFENEFAVPIIESLDVDLNLGSFQLNGSNITVEMYVEHWELDWMSAFSDQIFLIGVVLLPILIFLGAKLLGVPIKYAFASTFLWEAFWTILRMKL